MDMSRTEAFKARQHDVVTGRNRKGSTTQRVIRRGAATVQGAVDLDSDGLPLLAHDEHPSSWAARLLAQQVDNGNVRRRRFDLDTFGILAATDLAYDGLIEPLIGTDAMAYEEPLYGDRSFTSSAASGTSYLSGDFNDDDWDWFARNDTVCAGHDDKLSWPMVDELTYASKRRDSEQDERVIVVDSQGEATVTIRCTAPYLDDAHIWRGFKLSARGALADSTASKQASAARSKARTIGTVEAPESDAGWQALCETLNRDERVKVTYPDGLKRSVTYSAGGIYSSTDRDGKRWQTRTARAMAERLA